jgi:hypothetical protein
LAKEDELVLGFASYEHNYQDNDRTQSTKYMYCPNKAKELNTLIDLYRRTGNRKPFCGTFVKANRFNKACTLSEKGF